MMDYELEELLPVVAGLAKEYTGAESTSVTYERAEQLMEAVIYCIGEADENKSNALISGKKLPAQKAYEVGYDCVVKKVKAALDIYNQILQNFVCYENQCLHDTVIMGMPEFFKWYNARFDPQDTILTLDYLVLKDLSQYSGADKIYEYLSCIRIEQKFLNRFPEDYVINILQKYNARHRDMIENICEIVIMEVAQHSLAGKPMGEEGLKEEDYVELQKRLLQTETQEIRSYLKRTIKMFVQEHYEGDEELLNYLVNPVDDILVRMKTAAETGALGRSGYPHADAFTFF